MGLLTIDYFFFFESYSLVILGAPSLTSYPQCSYICVYVGSTVVLRSVAMRSFRLIISAQV
jgi:hypothetical protein